jgi:hypothetical protein
LAILASLLLPVLDKAKARAQRTRCQNNLKQLNFAWMMYFQDSNGHLTESYGSANPYAWTLGSMKNLNEAGDPEFLRQGKLYSYNRDVSLYHCPTDTGTILGGKKMSTVRSYSMNGFMGYRNPGVGPAVMSSSDYVSCFPLDSMSRRDGSTRRTTTAWRRRRGSRASWPSPRAPSRRITGSGSGDR